MEDRLLVDALRSRDPIAMGSVYDDYAERLYGYCWFQLRNTDAAQVAFRDTLMSAEAHIGRLRLPARFGPWLYALARIE
jgi:DNA-directed RNA polymerase specialized sigma24 family protein